MSQSQPERYTRAYVHCALGDFPLDSLLGCKNKHARANVHHRDNHRSVYKHPQSLNTITTVFPKQCDNLLAKVQKYNAMPLQEGKMSEQTLLLFYNRNGSEGGSPQ